MWRLVGDVSRSQATWLARSLQLGQGRATTFGFHSDPFVIIWGFTIPREPKYFPPKSWFPLQSGPQQGTPNFGNPNLGSGIANRHFHVSSKCSNLRSSGSLPGGPPCSRSKSAHGIQNGAPRPQKVQSARASAGERRLVKLMGIRTHRGE